MEDENKVKKTFTYVIVALIIAIIIVTIIFIYKTWQTSQNNERLYNYLKNNNYTQNDDGIYFKTIKEGNITTTDKAISSEYLFARDILTETTNYTTVSLEYKNDKTITINYQIEGYDKNNNYGILFQKGTYKNNKFKCEIITNKDFDTKCDVMKKAAQDYEKEINEILNKQNINSKYINIKTKQSSKV